MDAIHREFTSISSEDDDVVGTIVDLAVLFDRFQRLMTWNCPGTGYGKYPLDKSHSTDVSCLTRVSQRNFLKCKLHYRFDRMADAIAPAHPIEW